MSSSLIIAIAIVAVGLWWAAKTMRRRAFMRKMGASFGDFGLGSAERPMGKVSPQVRHKLLKLLGNNQATADRLIKQAKLRNPGEVEQWYWEKVLYDLERDRWR
jgi:hypothetical protein